MPKYINNGTRSIGEWGDVVKFGGIEQSSIIQYDLSKYSDLTRTDDLPVQSPIVQSYLVDKMDFTSTDYTLELPFLSDDDYINVSLLIIPNFDTSNLTRKLDYMKALKLKFNHGVSPTLDFYNTIGIPYMNGKIKRLIFSYDSTNYSSLDFVINIIILSDNLTLT